MTPDQIKRLKARHARIIEGLKARGNATQIGGAIRRAALRDLSRQMPAGDTASKPGGRPMAVWAGDGPAESTAKSDARVKRFYRFGTLRSAGRVVADPALGFSHDLAGRLNAARDPVRAPGVCKIIDPKTGDVLHTLDPITRREIPPK